MALSYLSLGSNIGGRREMINRAMSLIEAHTGHLITTSSWYLCEPWGLTGQNEFVNIAVALDTGLYPEELIIRLMRIENYLGKTIKKQYGPRNIDIDILLYEDHVVDHPNLIVPHPKLHERNFVLIPLAEIGPDLIHPIFDKTILQLKDECTDTCRVDLLSS